MLVITDQWNKGHLARAVPGAFFDHERRAWCIDLDRADTGARVALAKLFPEHGKSIDLTSAAADIRPLDLATPWAAGRTAADLLPGVHASRRDVLKDYQVTDLAYLDARMHADGGAYNGWDRGLGKTLGALVQIEARRATHAMVVTPRRSIRPTWIPEAVKWRPDLPTYQIGSTATQRARAVSDWQREGGLLLCHYEALRLIDWKRCAVDLLIVDEAHRLANGGPPQGSKVPAFYKALKHIPAEYRLAMSGSIIINGAEDVFGAGHWLFPDRYRSKWRDWMDRFMLIIDTPNGKVNAGVRPEVLEELRHELASWMVVRSKDDELPDLPPRIDVVQRVELSKPQRKAYDDLAKRFFAQLDDGTVITAPSVVAQLTKLRQVATGLDLVSNTIQDSTKLDFVEELVRDNLPHKTVVFAWHRATVDALAERLADVGAVGVHGGKPEAQTDAAVHDFQNDPSVKVIVATIKTLGESVTLHAAADVVFVEHSWTAADMEQAADRVRRIGQTRRVTLTEVVAADTIDEHLVIPTVKTKAEIRRLLFGGAA